MDKSSTNNPQHDWAKDAAKLLLGRRIVTVRYLTIKEIKALGWLGSSIVLQLDDGTAIYPSRDDEGNGPGALFTTNEEIPTIPAIR